MSPREPTNDAKNKCNFPRVPSKKSIFINLDLIEDSVLDELPTTRKNESVNFKNNFKSNDRNKHRKQGAINQQAYKTSQPAQPTKRTKEINDNVRSKEYPSK